MTSIDIATPESTATDSGSASGASGKSAATNPANVVVTGPGAGGAGAGHSKGQGDISDILQSEVWISINYTPQNEK